MSSISDTLLGRLQCPDPDDEAWARLIQLCGRPVYARCRRASIPPQDVEDVGNEVFFDVSRGIRGFRRDRPGDTFRGWLAQIARRRIADYWRRQQHTAEGTANGGSAARERLGDIPDGHESAEVPGSRVLPQTADADDGLRDDLRRQALKLIESRFERQTWQACWLVVMERRPAEAVAEKLGITVNAVRVAKSRVMKELREEFGDLLV